VLVLAVVGFCVTLVTVGVLLLVIAEERFVSADEIAAIGDVLVFGTFLAALVAGGVAVFAYDDATRRLKLVIMWALDGDPVGKPPLKFLEKPPPSRTFSGKPSALFDAGQLIPLKSARLRVRVLNTGRAAARDVIVAFFMEGIFFECDPSRAESPQWRFYRLSDKGWHVEWRPDSIIYVGGEAWIDAVPLTGIWAVQKMYAHPARRDDDSGWFSLVSSAE
jgi:hypothetical protein